jgi:epoxyqueuosine reductase
MRDVLRERPEAGLRGEGADGLTAAGPLEPRLKAEAARLGFSLSGVAPATDADGFDRFERWLDAGHAGDMGYLHRGREARRHPRAVAAGVRSVVMVGMEYAAAGASGGRQPPGEDSQHRGADAPRSPVGVVARYARGPDYHHLIWNRLNALAAWLTNEAPGCSARGVCDTAPLLERDFARRAGLGWFGKNTMLINPTRGSYFVLGALLTDLDLAPDQAFAANHCGTCTACLDACPTGAFPEPGVLDARRCISYLTIEVRTPIPVELREGVGDRLWGCDACQEACPWNRFAGRDGVPFPAEPDLAALDPVEVLTLPEDEFRRRFKRTALWRNRRAGLRRNAAIVLGNVGDERAIPALEAATAEGDEVLQEAAAWAIGRIRQRASNR